MHIAFLPPFDFDLTTLDSWSRHFAAPSFPMTQREKESTTVSNAWGPNRSTSSEEVASALTKVTGTPFSDGVA